MSKFWSLCVGKHLDLSCLVSDTTFCLPYASQFAHLLVFLHRRKKALFIQHLLGLFLSVTDLITHLKCVTSQTLCSFIHKMGIIIAGSQTLHKNSFRLNQKMSNSFRSLSTSLVINGLNYFQPINKSLFLLQFKPSIMSLIVYLTSLPFQEPYIDSIPYINLLFARKLNSIISTFI